MISVHILARKDKIKCPTQGGNLMIFFRKNNGVYVYV